MATLRDLLADPDFQALSPAEKRYVAGRVDSDFAGLDDKEKDYVLNKLGSTQPTPEPQWTGSRGVIPPSSEVQAPNDTGLSDAEMRQAVESSPIAKALAPAARGVVNTMANAPYGIVSGIKQTSLPSFVAGMANAPPIPVTEQDKLAFIKQARSMTPAQRAAQGITSQDLVEPPVEKVLKFKGIDPAKAQADLNAAYSSGAQEVEQEAVRSAAAKGADVNSFGFKAGGFVGSMADPIFLAQPEVGAAPAIAERAVAKIGAPVVRRIAGMLAKQATNVPLDLLSGAVSEVAKTGTADVTPGGVLKQSLAAATLRSMLGLLHMKASGPAAAFADDVKNALINADQDTKVANAASKLWGSFAEWWTKTTGNSIDDFRAAHEYLWKRVHGNDVPEMPGAVAEPPVGEAGARTAGGPEINAPTTAPLAEPTQLDYLTQQHGGTVVKGFTDLENRVIGLLDKADPSTIVHESAHGWRQAIYGTPEGQLIDRWAGVKPGGEWPVAAEEKFARAIENYVRDGKAPTPALSKAFADFRNWMTDIYQSVKGSSIDVPISDEVRSAFDRMFGSDVAKVRGTQAAAEAAAATGERDRAPILEQRGDPATAEDVAQRLGGEVNPVYVDRLHLLPEESTAVVPISKVGDKPVLATAGDQALVSKAPQENIPRLTNPQRPATPADSVYLPGTPVAKLEEELATRIAKDDSLHGVTGAPPQRGTPLTISALEERLRGFDPKFAAWYPEFGGDFNGVAGHQNLLELLYAWSALSPQTKVPENLQGALYALILKREHPDWTPEQLTEAFTGRHIGLTDEVRRRVTAANKGLAPDELKKLLSSEVPKRVRAIMMKRDPEMWAASHWEKTSTGAMGRHKSSDDQILRMFRVLKDPAANYSEALSQKIGNFGSATAAPIFGHYRVGSTQDVWMARFFGFPKDTLTPDEYRWAMATTNALARRLGISPDAIQALAWGGEKAGRGDISGSVTEAFSRHPELIDRARRVIANSPDPNWSDMQRTAQVFDARATSPLPVAYATDHPVAARVLAENAATAPIEPAGPLTRGLSPEQVAAVRDASLRQARGEAGSGARFYQDLNLPVTVHPGGGTFASEFNPNLQYSVLSGDPRAAQIVMNTESALRGQAEGTTFRPIPPDGKLLPNEQATAGVRITGVDGGEVPPATLRALYVDVKAAIPRAELNDAGRGGVMFVNLGPDGKLAPDRKFATTIANLAKRYRLNSDVSTLAATYVKGGENLRGYAPGLQAASDFVVPAAGGKVRVGALLDKHAEGILRAAAEGRGASVPVAEQAAHVERTKFVKENLRVLLQQEDGLTPHDSPEALMKASGDRAMPETDRHPEIRAGDEVPGFGRALWVSPSGKGVLVETKYGGRRMLTEDKLPLFQTEEPPQGGGRSPFNVPMPATEEEMAKLVAERQNAGGEGGGGGSDNADAFMRGFDEVVPGVPAREHFTPGGAEGAPPELGPPEPPKPERVPQFVEQKPEGVVAKLKRALNPLAAQRPEVQKVWQNWDRAIKVANEDARAEVANLPEMKDGLKVMLDYEAGRSTPYSDQIRERFRALGQEAQDKGIEFDSRQNYIPQSWKNSPVEVKNAVVKYLEDQGVDRETIAGYVNGTRQLSSEQSRRLGINPSFTRARMLPDYATGMKYGLTPRFTQPAQLAAAYKMAIDRAVANRTMLEDLTQLGLVAQTSKAPKNFDPLIATVSPKDLSAEPGLAKMLNDYFRDEAKLGFGETLWKAGAGASRAMQEIRLSAGLPYTQMNFFSTGQLIKEVVAGNFRAVSPFLRSNFTDAPTVRYFAENAPVFRRMAEEGLDVANRVGKYQTVYANMAEKGILDELGAGRVKEAAGQAAEKTKGALGAAFNDKVFAQFMPSLYLETFKQAEKRMLAKGMKPADAQRIAADTVRAFYGVMENVGRGRATEDVLTSTFFAPKFRENVINSLINTLKSGTTEWRNPAFYKNRRLLAGMILTYGAYSALNQKLTGHPMKDNPSGKEFALEIPTGSPGSEHVFVEFMPSYLSFARNLGSGALAAYRGDVKTATQKFGSNFSMPVQLVSQVLSNKDYFGRQIYGDNDPRAVKAKKVAAYMGLQVSHPFVTEIVKQLTTDKPIIQSVSEALEWPLKFMSDTQYQRQVSFDAKRKAMRERQ